MLKFTPLEFETICDALSANPKLMLKFTPLEFETTPQHTNSPSPRKLKFTPLEFETRRASAKFTRDSVKIYSVGV